MTLSYEINQCNRMSIKHAVADNATHLEIEQLLYITNMKLQVNVN